MGPLFLEFNQNAFGFCQCGVWIFFIVFASCSNDSKLFHCNKWI